MMTQVRRWGIRLGLFAIVGGLLWFTLRAVAIAEVWTVLRRLGPAQLLLLAVANVVVLATFNLRWWLFLRAEGYAIPYLNLMGYRLATFAVSYFTPGSHFGGEPLQVYFATKRHGVPMTIALSAVLLDKIIELLFSFVFLVCAALAILPRYALDGDLASYTGYGLFLVLLPAGLVLALGVGRHPLAGLIAIVEATWRRVNGGRKAEALARLGQSIRQGEGHAAALCRMRPRLLMLAIAASILSWVAIIGEYWLMTALLGLDLTLSEALVSLMAARVAILLPVPAGLGVLEASQVLAVYELGLPLAAGVSLGLLIRVRDVVVGIVGLWLGSGYLWGEQETRRSGDLSD